MARREVVVFCDDMDGSELPAGHKPERFNVNGTTYEIDLNETNAAELRKRLDDIAAMQAALLGDYVKVARKVEAAAPAAKANGRGKAAPAQSKAAQKYTRDSMRSWARGYMPTMPERGRIAAEIEAAYNNGRDVEALKKFARSKQMTWREGGRMFTAPPVPVQAAAPEAESAPEPVAEPTPEPVEEPADTSAVELPADKPAKPARAPRKKAAAAKK